jgi:hypothetical protein
MNWLQVVKIQVLLEFLSQQLSEKYPLEVQEMQDQCVVAVWEM